MENYRRTAKSVITPKFGLPESSYAEGKSGLYSLNGTFEREKNRSQRKYNVVFCQRFLFYS